MPTLVAFNGRRQFNVDHEPDEVAGLLNGSSTNLVRLTLSARSGGVPGTIWVNPVQVTFIVDARENI